MLVDILKFLFIPVFALGVIWIYCMLLRESCVCMVGMCVCTCECECVPLVFLLSGLTVICSQTISFVSLNFGIYVTKGFDDLEQTVQLVKDSEECK